MPGIRNRDKSYLSGKRINPERRQNVSKYKVILVLPQIRCDNGTGIILKKKKTELYIIILYYLITLF